MTGWASCWEPNVQPTHYLTVCPPTHSLRILFLVVVTEQEAGEGSPIMRLPFMQTPAGSR